MYMIREAVSALNRRVEITYQNINYYTNEISTLTPKEQNNF